MALHLTHEEHDANPPASWEVVKQGYSWFLMQRGHKYPEHGQLGTFQTRKAAAAAKSAGFLVELYAKEGRWFAGETVPGWKPYKRRL